VDRTQPGLTLKKGRLGMMTHDYKRNGTTCLFAALELLQGMIVGQLGICIPDSENAKTTFSTEAAKAANSFLSSRRPEPGLGLGFK